MTYLISIVLIVSLLIIGFCVSIVTAQRIREGDRLSGAVGLFFTAVPGLAALWIWWLS